MRQVLTGRINIIAFTDKNLGDRVLKLDGRDGEGGRDDEGVAGGVDDADHDGQHDEGLVRREKL